MFETVCVVKNDGQRYFEFATKIALNITHNEKNYKYKYNVKELTAV